MLSRTLLITSTVENWTLGLMNELPREKWASVGYAKADMLFIAVAAAILNGEIPDRLEIKTENVGGMTIPSGSNISGNLAARPSVQKALDEFLAAEGAQWAPIYNKWQTTFEDKFPGMPIEVWRGIATALAKSCNIDRC
jgi:hypothetical protein